jgi:NitT/TauT family transport system ATP-binding protein
MAELRSFRTVEQLERDASVKGSAITTKSLSKKYSTRSGSVLALDNVNLAIEPGQFVSVLGPSGCGKSTLLRLVAGLELPSEGEVILNDLPVTGPQTQLGIVFQAPLLLDWRDAIGNVLLQAEARGMNKSEAEQRARELMHSVGLKGFEHKWPRELSGGMQQRLSICRAFLHNPATILMDEPFGALDALTRDQMTIDLQSLWQKGDKTVLFVTHSITESVFLSDRVIVMSARPGRVALDLQIDLPRPRRMRMRESEEFLRYQRLIRAQFASTGILREEED